MMRKLRKPREYGQDKGNESAEGVTMMPSSAILLDPQQSAEFTKALETTSDEEGRLLARFLSPRGDKK